MTFVQPHPLKKAISWSIGFLCLIALLSLIWPVYRAFLPGIINGNEAWNAYWTEAVFGKMSLYPSLDKLITNNYPPLSYYLVGGFGKILGNNILAGRLISLLSLGGIAFFIAQIVRSFNGSKQASIIGAAYFLATMSLFYRWYVGMNDPQLLAEAIMLGGFFLFLRAANSDKNYWLPMLVMVTAGFFKHNIVTLPISALLWLVVQCRWKPLFICCCWSLLFVIIGFALCISAYGPDFVYNLLTPRRFFPSKTMDAITTIYPLLIALGAWFWTSWKFRSEAFMRLIFIVIVVGLIVGFIQRLGSGVFINAHFDLIIAVAVSVGVAFNLLEKWTHSSKLLQLLLLISLSLPFLLSSNFFSFIDPFSPAAREERAHDNFLIAQKIAEVRATPGDIFCEISIAYQAGKPFAIDAFNTNERIIAGKLPKDAIEQRINNHTLTLIDCDWYFCEE